MTTKAFAKHSIHFCTHFSITCFGMQLMMMLLEKGVPSVRAEKYLLHRVNCSQTRESKEAQSGNPKDSMEHIHHVARSI